MDLSDFELAKKLQEEENASLPASQGASPFASEGRFTPFSDQMSPDQKLEWLRSPSGQRVLSHRPRLQHLYEEGKLQKMIKSPEWSDRLNSWLSIPGQSITGSRQHSLATRLTRPAGSFWSWLSPSRKPPEYSTETAVTVPIESFPEEVKLNLMINGFAVLSDYVPAQLCRDARKAINYGLGHEKPEIDQHSKLASSFSADKKILDLYCASRLFHAVSHLIHGSFADAVVPRQAQIALRFPEYGEVRADGRLGGLQWHIDGMNKGDHSPFTLLVGVALSDQTEPFMGNLCVFPGSHYRLQDQLRNTVLADRSAGAAMRPKVSFGIDDAFDPLVARPDLGEPEQLLLKRGDVVILHQKTAHRGGPNYSEEIRQMVYFRISHRRHHELRHSCVEDIWVEFEGMRDVL